MPSCQCLAMALVSSTKKNCILENVTKYKQINTVIIWFRSQKIVVKQLTLLNGNLLHGNLTVIIIKIKINISVHNFTFVMVQYQHIKTNLSYFVRYFTIHKNVYT